MPVTFTLDQYISWSDGSMTGTIIIEPSEFETIPNSNFITVPKLNSAFFEGRKVAYRVASDGVLMNELDRPSVFVIHS